jgi:WhiB family redox-sensing transcriptional regulator
MSWQALAACRSIPLDAFIVDDVSDRQRQEALKFCVSCPVRAECLADALSATRFNPPGIWGGTTRQERFKMKGTR